MRQWRILDHGIHRDADIYPPDLLSPGDEDYSKLQDELVRRPDAGDLIREGGGIRKLRWKRPGTGKSGGIRVIYYWLVDEDNILMLVAYAKNVKDNLNAQETEILRKLVKEL